MIFDLDNFCGALLFLACPSVHLSILKNGPLLGTLKYRNFSGKPCDATR